MKSLYIRAQPFNKALCWACAKPPEKTPVAEAGLSGFCPFCPSPHCRPRSAPGQAHQLRPDVGISLSPVSFLSLESPEGNLMVAFT